MFRVHGSYGLNPGKEFWRFDAGTQDVLRTYLNLRYRLLPYTYSVAWQVTSGGSTFMQPLVMDFPKDPKVVDIGNQYLFGPAIMVTPVTTAGATEQAVYLPAAGAPWYNFWTGETSASGKSIEASAPVTTLPLFVRPGAIIPMGPFLQYSNEKPTDPIELRVYRGADGRFTLYEDEGDTYDYEKGQYATIPIIWHAPSTSSWFPKTTAPGWLLRPHTTPSSTTTAKHCISHFTEDKPFQILLQEIATYETNRPLHLPNGRPCGQPVLRESEELFNRCSGQARVSAGAAPVYVGGVDTGASFAL